MTKVQRAPGIPREKSRTVRPVHGPATIHLRLQGDALRCREASALSLRHTMGVPTRMPGTLGSGCPSVAGSCRWPRLDRRPSQMARLSMPLLERRVNSHLSLDGPDRRVCGTNQPGLGGSVAIFQKRRRKPYLGRSPYGALRWLRGRIFGLHCSHRANYGIVGSTETTTPHSDKAHPRHVDACARLNVLRRGYVVRRCDHTRPPWPPAR